MWQLKSFSDTERLYFNPQTGSQSPMTLVKIDLDGNKWWRFDNLFMMPFSRQFAATKITSLYQLGLTKDDLAHHVNSLKALLKSSDKDKYEKCYGQLIEFENKAESATNAVRQMSSLVCVYYTMNNEDIDSFIDSVQYKKMAILEADQELHSFFLSDQIKLIENYNQHLGILSQTVTTI